MTLPEIKDLLSFAKELGIAHIKAGDVEATFAPGLAAELPLASHDAPSDYSEELAHYSALGRSQRE
jgi:hypothetical protein